MYAVTSFGEKSEVNRFSVWKQLMGGSSRDALYLWLIYSTFSGKILLKHMKRSEKIIPIV
ncbi:hypothetical protein GCM10028778_09030 [Barrientosiimonas marina]